MYGPPRQRREGQAGTTRFDRADRALAPAPLIATTLNRYEVPFVRPVSVWLVLAGPKVVEGRTKYPT
jgi:hypothetical protein